MAYRVGQQLGNYRLLRLLGQGCFAEVYVGEHVYLETQALVLQTALAEYRSHDPFFPERLARKKRKYNRHQTKPESEQGAQS